MLNTNKIKKKEKKKKKKERSKHTQEHLIYLAHPKLGLHPQIPYSIFIMTYSNKIYKYYILYLSN